MKIVLLALFVAAVAAFPAEKSKELEPSPIAIPELILPEIIEELPKPEAQFGEIFNDGNVQVAVNTPEDPGMLATLQSWLNMVINYISNGGQTSEQIV
ncbi:hypothetical protein KGM_214311 [Danaus plexippus plexippus]|uniref:Uncharacterized protein n=1 Tax=Danaus plexippus plexippus TaxID=278856 RepID=A0A212EH00_DANPL|nr:hypothetical protein KGM_214311 [Danaus plexippus plexippus]